MTEIKQCNHCGGNGELTGRKKFRVVCKKCGATGAERPLPSEAISCWNGDIRQEDGIVVHKAERCVFCKSIIPEGIQICSNCKERIEKNMENKGAKIERNKDPKTGPTDGVSCIVRGCFTNFSTKNGPGTMKQSIVDCKLLASFENGVVSISTRESKKVMVSVRLDEMVELINAAIQAAKENESFTAGEQNDG